MSQPARPHETLGSYSHDDSRVQAPEKNVPSLGSWAKLLYFKPLITLPEPSTHQDYDPAIVRNQLAALCPSKVLMLGPENKDEYIIGKFHKCSLPQVV